MSWWKVFKSRVAGKVPSVNQLDLDSIGINSADGKMFIKKNDGGVESIVEIGGGGTGVTHDRAHQIDSAADHPAVAEGDRNKLVATNATTGAVELIDKITSINFEVRDLEAADFFVIDLNAPFAYTILGITVQSDAAKATLNVAVNATNAQFNSIEDIPVTTTKTYIAATSANAVSINDTVKVVVEAISATRIYGSLKIEIL